MGKLCFEHQKKRQMSTTLIYGVLSTKQETNEQQTSDMWKEHQINYRWNKNKKSITIKYGHN
jgi:hypothetical protein